MSALLKNCYAYVRFLCVTQHCIYWIFGITDFVPHGHTGPIWSLYFRFLAAPIAASWSEGPTTIQREVNWWWMNKFPLISSLNTVKVGKRYGNFFSGSSTYLLLGIYVNLFTHRGKNKFVTWLLLLVNICDVLSAQSSLSIFAQKYLHKCEDIYFILQKKYLHIYKDSFGAKILSNDCALKNVTICLQLVT